jgi:D-alanyl-D-alanine carboxypeptidase
MTLFMLFEALERGQVTMDTQMPVSAHAAAAAPSKLGLTRKQKITVEQAIGALITKSANDVAIVTAEKLGGTEASFADMMTDRARQLGMSGTTFKNASGLPNPEQFSTARDMANLANHLIKDFPQHYAQFSRIDFNYKGQNIHTHNRLLEFYEGADGIKTGYTAASGFNLVGSATRNGYRVIGVIFGGTSAGSRDKRLASLMDNGFNTLSGLPNTAIASNGNTLPFIDRTDTIGTQIAAIDKPTEQGDSDTPFVSVTGNGVGIETTSLPPIAAPAKAVRTAALAQPVPKTPAPKTASMDDVGDVSGIQIGAFSTRDRAATQADAAVQRLKTAFVGATAVVMPVKVKGRMVYRARIMGIGEDDLLRACSMVPKSLKAGACQAIKPAA